MTNVKDPRRQIRGALNRSTGAAFEDLITAACERYKILGIANVEKTPEPFKPVSGIHQKGRLWVFDCVATKKAQPDFKGTLSGGRAVCFEAKTSDNDRIEQSVVTDEQDKELDFHNRLGALVFVCVALKMQKFYKIPWDIWKGMKGLYGRKYMTQEDLDEYKLDFKNGVLQII